jgi:spore germination protein GerM
VKGQIVSLLALSAFAVTGCGVSAEDSPREIEPPRGPYPTLGSVAPSTPEPGTAAEPLYFVRDDKLVAVIRRVPTPPTAEDQLENLIAGPTDAELARGLSSSLSGSSIVGQVKVSGEVATIDVGDTGEDVERSDEVLAFGQIVCTLTARPEITAVTFRHDGRRLGIPRADGSLSTAPLTAADYATLTAPA